MQETRIVNHHKIFRSPADVQELEYSPPTHEFKMVPSSLGSEWPQIEPSPEGLQPPICSTRVSASPCWSVGGPRGGSTLSPGSRTYSAPESARRVKTRRALKPGDSIDMWVDQNGSQAGPPTPTRAAAEQAVVAAVAIWLSVSVAAAALFFGTRAILDRVHHARWQRDFDTLIES
jgi:hypothetical protein